MEQVRGNAEKTANDIDRQVIGEARQTLRFPLIQKKSRPLIALLSGLNSVNRRQRRRHCLFKRAMSFAVIHTDEAPKDFGGGRSE
jgi:hypothetical protein